MAAVTIVRPKIRRRYCSLKIYSPSFCAAAARKITADLKRAIELDPAEEDHGANRARAIVLGLHEAFEAKEAEGVM